MIKLSKKIRALERNVSVSGEYLEHLSVQYKKQIEDLQMAVRQSGEALAEASKAREFNRDQVKNLTEQVGQLKIVVEEVSSRMEAMSTWVIRYSSSFTWQLFLKRKWFCFRPLESIHSFLSSKYSSAFSSSSLV